MKHPYVLELCKSVNGSELNNKTSSYRSSGFEYALRGAFLC